MLFGRQLFLLRRVVNRLDAFEERFVLRDLIVEGGEFGRHLAPHNLEFRIRHGAGPDAVNGGYAIERVTCFLQLDDRVVKSRCG